MLSLVCVERILCAHDLHIVIVLDVLQTMLETCVSVVWLRIFNLFKKFRVWWWVESFCALHVLISRILGSAYIYQQTLCVGV